MWAGYLNEKISPEGRTAIKAKAAAGGKEMVKVTINKNTGKKVVTQS